MKEYIRQLLEKVADNNLGRCKIREYLQARILQVLQEKAAFATWAFLGGTALRFLYALPRFSEDLDFSLVKSGLNDRFIDCVKAIKAVFAAEGYQVSIRVNIEKNVKSAFIKFTGLLFELGYSPHRAEVISIKIELDTAPPEGANVVSTIVRKYVILNIQHYAQSSLFARKLHALLMRKYLKGRDVYDLFWYLSDRNWPAPDILLLNNALKQTGWSGSIITPENWKNILVDQVKSYNWNRVIEDVKPFLEHPEECALLTQENLIQLLGPGL